MYTLDTNAIIYYLRDDPEAVNAFREISVSAAPLYISTITEIELFGFPHLSDEEAEKIERVLSVLSIVPLDSQIARLAGMLRRKYHLKVPDSAIAATALFTNTQLVTRNVRDFKKVQEITLYPI